MENLPIIIKNQSQYKANIIESIIEYAENKIVISPFYFSQSEHNNDNTCVSFSIFLTKNFYLNYHIKYVKNKSYHCVINGGRTSEDIICKQHNLLTRLEKNGVYTCDLLEEVPAIVNSLYSNFYYEEFNEIPTHNLFKLLNQTMNELKKNYENDIKQILNDKSKINQYYQLTNNLNTDLLAKHKTIKI